MPNVQGQPFATNTGPIRLQRDYSIALETGAVITAQTAAFLTLRLKTPSTENQDQFSALNTILTPDDPDATSALGTPIYGQLILGRNDGELNTYTDAQGNAGYYRTMILDCALVDVDFNSKVVITNIQGLKTSIKEFISSGDNDITITGIYNSTPNVAPKEFILNLNALFSAPVPIPVYHYKLELLNINYIVIMPGTSMPSMEGGYATQTFTIKAITDSPMTQMLP